MSDAAQNLKTPKPRTKPKTVTNSNGTVSALIKPKLTYNPLELMAAGKRAPDIKRANGPHMKSARIGNLVFEYTRNVDAFRNKGVTGEHISDFFAKAGLMVVDDGNGDPDERRYDWVGEPISKSDFLRIFTGSKA